MPQSISISLLIFFTAKYPFYANQKQARKIVFSIAIFIGLFCIVFQPFGMAACESPYLIALGFGLVTLFTCYFNIVILPKIFPDVLNNKDWKVYKEILWVLWIVFTIGAANFFYTSLFFIMEKPILCFLVIQLFTAIIALLPAIAIIQYKRIHSLNGKINYSTDSSLEAIIFYDSKGTNCLKVSPQQLLYVASNGNYVNVFFQKGDLTKKEMIRNTLSKTEAQLIAFPYLKRAHRSFIVNLKKVEKLKKKGHRLELVLSTNDEKIPVSKQYEKAVKSGMDHIVE